METKVTVDSSLAIQQRTDLQRQLDRVLSRVDYARGLSRNSMAWNRSGNKAIQDILNEREAYLLQARQLWFGSYAGKSYRWHSHAR